MATISFKDKTYDIDERGFLLDYNQWDEDFATLMSSKLNIAGELSEAHWDVIRYIRGSFFKHRTCPTVYQTCKAKGLKWRDLKQIFPTGYLRGACLISGITYGDILERAPERHIEKEESKQIEKIYQINVRGFLINPFEWDEEYAINKASELKIPGGLSKKHWQIINFLRESYKVRGVVPTVYQCCEANSIELDDLERLFPDGYHRGAVKIAGLQVKVALQQVIAPIFSIGNVIRIKKCSERPELIGTEGEIVQLETQPEEQYSVRPIWVKITDGEGKSGTYGFWEHEVEPVNAGKEKP